MSSRGAAGFDGRGFVGGFLLRGTFVEQVEQAGHVGLGTGRSRGAPGRRLVGVDIVTRSAAGGSDW